MKNKNQKTSLTLAALLLCMVMCSCQKLFLEKDIASSPSNNFEYLWNDIKNRYAYLDYKQLNWDSLHDVFAAQVHDDMLEEQLFSVLADMMNTLRDDHVNLTSPFNVSIYYPIFLNSPQDYDGRLLLQYYLLRNPDAYFITGPFSNTILDTLGVKIGYIRYSSFSNTIKPTDIDYVINRFVEANVNGVIIDVRNNGGGSVSNVFPFADRFADALRPCYTSQIKTGPGPGDFGDDEQVNISPAGAQQFTGRIALLTNRSSYSATSLFTLAMKALPYVKIVGDSTGGGLGAPGSGELPNGWIYRFSVTHAIAPGGENWENGIPADIPVDLDPDLAQQGFDSMIERAIQYIINGN